MISLIAFPLIVLSRSRLPARMFDLGQSTSRDLVLYLLRMMRTLVPVLRDLQERFVSLGCNVRAAAVSSAARF
jgi:hypothetical protein